MNKLMDTLMDASPDSLRVQVCYAKPEMQSMYDVCVPSGATVQAAILRSGILHDLPEIDLQHCRVGIYARIKTLETTLREGDRIEIYRPLIADPKVSRRLRADRKLDRNTAP